MKWIVTGGAGMIGSNLVHRLLDQGDEVVAVDNLSGGFRGALPREGAEGFQFFQEDVLSPYFEEIVGDFKPDVVAHLSAYAAECLSPWIREFNARNNYQATTRVVSLAVKHDVQHVVFTSSAAVYGHTIGFAKEESPNPGDPYGITKLAGELDIKEAFLRFGFPTFTIYRPHNVYGRWQCLSDKYRNVVGIFMRQVLDGQPMTVYGDGTQVRQFTYVEDVVDIMAQSFDCPELQNKVLNVGSDEAHTVLDLAQEIQAIAGTGKIEHLQARNEAHVVRTDHSRLHRAGFRCDTPFREGLVDMWEWAKAAPRWTPEFPDAEHKRGLYSYWKD
jgi:UDP-glucose 4-epimerase